MKLRDDLYSIVRRSSTSHEEAAYTVRFNADAAIYKAHFPGHPVTPGVCIAQMITEVLADHLQGDYTISKVKNIKFLQVIDPTTTTEADIELKKITHAASGTVSLQATVCSGGTTYAKASLTCSL